MYTPFSAGKTFGNQETKIILCAFSHSIYSSPIHNLFAVSFGHESTEAPNATVLRSDLFNRLAINAPALIYSVDSTHTEKPFRDPGPSLLPGAFLPSFLSL